MKWFTGSIPEAINYSKTNNLLFIVYISGKDDSSKQMLETWENAEVCQFCEQEKCVAIKVEADSDACGFFSQIYPVVVVPSTFFVGINGIPIEVTGGFVESAEFLKIIESVIQTHKSKIQTPVQTARPQSQTASLPQSTDASLPQSTDASLPQSTEAASAPASEASPRATDEAAESSESPDDTSEAKKPKLDFDARVELAKQKMEQKKQEKMLKDIEEQKNKEQDYRKTGRNLQKLREYQVDRELRETHEQMKKDKEEERKARERVKQDIARDRAERAAKFTKEKEDRQRVTEESKHAKLVDQQKLAEQAEARRSTVARLQFRLTDGTRITQEFPSSETLQTANTFISEHLNGSVSLSTIFPKRVFTEEDMASTLADLNLAPSSVIIVLPKRHAVTQFSGGGGSGNLISMLLAPLMMIWNFVVSFFTSGPPPPTSSTSSATSPSPQATGGDRVQSSAYSRRPQGGVSRREGNLHRFTNKQDDDDESATWNGNSTQQL